MPKKNIMRAHHGSYQLIPIYGNQFPKSIIFGFVRCSYGSAITMIFFVDALSFLNDSKP